MPPKKRTSQPKRTPPASPTTSTSHVSADQHHHLRHTRSSISTRAGVGAAPSKPPPAPAQTQPTSESPSTQQGPLGARASFTKSMYVLLSLALLLLGWYVYGMVTLLERLKDEVGWWGIIAGDTGGIPRWETLKGGWGIGSDRASEAAKCGDLEGSLNALADALGISPVQVASAVKPLIPQASLTSIASKETGGSSEAVKILYEDTTRNGKGKAGTTGVAEESAERLEKGLDEEY